MKFIGFIELSKTCLFVCLFDWALDSEIQLWVGPYCGVQPLAQGVGVFVTPLLPHLRREAGEPVRRSQREGIGRDPTASSILTPHNSCDLTPPMRGTQQIWNSV